MAVYREGYSIVKSLISQSGPVFNDAADWGAPVKIGDKNWNMIKQLIDWYRNKDIPVTRNSMGCCTQIQLMDEWAVSDQRKTVQQATEIYEVVYTRLNNFRNNDIRLNPQYRGMDGFISVYRA